MVRSKLPRFTQLLQFSQSDPIPLEISSNFVGCDQKVWVYMCLCVSCAESTKTNKKCNPAKCRVAGRQVLPPNRTNTSSRGKPASTFPNPRRWPPTRDIYNVFSSFWWFWHWGKHPYLLSKHMFLIWFDFLLESIPGNILKSDLIWKRAHFSWRKVQSFAGTWVSLRNLEFDV